MPFILLALFLSLTACNAIEKHENDLDTWKGANINQLVNHLGEPQQVMDLHNGYEILAYIQYYQDDSNQITLEDQYNNGYGGFNRAYGGTAYTFDLTPPSISKCQTYFLVDRNGIVQDWARNRNICTTANVPVFGRSEYQVSDPNSGRRTRTYQWGHTIIRQNYDVGSDEIMKTSAGSSITEWGWRS